MPTDQRSSAKHPVLVASSGGQALARVTVQRAATLLVMDLALPIETAPVIAVLRSPSLSVTVHEAISVTRSAYRPWAGRDADSYASNHAILARDGHRCAYCGRRGDTVDHVLPSSRGGASSFGNLVTACRACNGRKADRTPEEAGMELLWAPYVHDPWAQDQARIHELFALYGEAEPQEQN